MYILYKEVGTFLPTVKPIYWYGDRVLAQIDDPTTLTHLTGNIKVVSDELVELVGPNYGRFDWKYYVRADGEGISTSKVSNEDQKVTVEFTPEETAGILELYKLVLVSNIEDVFSNKFKALQLTKPELETSTWTVQEQESRAYVADNTTTTPVLAVLAEARGITVAELATRVIEKADNYNISVASLLGQQKALTDEVNSATELVTLLKFNEDKFGVRMGDKIAIQFGLIDEETGRRINPPNTTVQI